MVSKEGMFAHLEETAFAQSQGKTYLLIAKDPDLSHSFRLKLPDASDGIFIVERGF